MENGELDREVIAEMFKIGALIRGEVLNYFCDIEMAMSEIIRRITFDSPELYESYMKLLMPGEMPMSTKKALLKMCLTKYETQYGADMSGVITQIDNIVKQRNIVAHYALDFSRASINFFVAQKKESLMFVSQVKKGKTELVCFSIDMVEKMIKTITSVMAILRGVIYHLKQVQDTPA